MDDDFTEGIFDESDVEDYESEQEIDYEDEDEDEIVPELNNEIDQTKKIAEDLFSNFEKTLFEFTALGDKTVEESSIAISFLDEERKTIEAMEEANQISWITKEREILENINKIYASGFERGKQNNTGINLTSDENEEIDKLLSEHRKIVSNWRELHADSLIEPLDGGDQELDTKLKETDVFAYLELMAKKEEKLVNKALRSVGLKIPKIKNNEDPNVYLQRKQKLFSKGLSLLDSYAPLGVGITKISEGEFKKLPSPTSIFEQKTQPSEKIEITEEQLEHSKLYYKLIKLNVNKLHECIIKSGKATTDNFKLGDSYISSLQNNRIKVTNQVNIPVDAVKKDIEETKTKLISWAKNNLPENIYTNIIGYNNSGYSLQQLYNYIQGSLGYFIPKELLVKHDYTYTITNEKTGKTKIEKVDNRPTIILIKTPVPIQVTRELGLYGFVNKIPKTNEEPLWKQYYKIYYPDPTNKSLNVEYVWMFKDGNNFLYYKNFEDYLKEVKNKLENEPSKNKNKIKAIEIYLQHGVAIPWEKKDFELETDMEIDQQILITDREKEEAINTLKKCKFSDFQVMELVSMLTDKFTSLARFKVILKNLCLISELEPSSLQNVNLIELYVSASNPKSNLFPIPLSLRQKYIEELNNNYTSLFKVYGEPTIESIEGINLFSKFIENTIKNRSINVQDYIKNQSKMSRDYDNLSKFYNHTTREIDTNNLEQKIINLTSVPVSEIPESLQIVENNLTELSSKYDILKYEERQMNQTLNMYEVYLGGNNILKWVPWDWMNEQDKIKWEQLKNQTIQELSERMRIDNIDRINKGLKTITDIEVYLLPTFLQDYKELPIQTLFKKLREKYKRFLDINISELHKNIANINNEKQVINEQIATLRQRLSLQQRSVKGVTSKLKTLSINVQVRTPPKITPVTLKRALDNVIEEEDILKPKTKQKISTGKYILADVIFGLWGTQAKNSTYVNEYKIQYFKPSYDNPNEPGTSVRDPTNTQNKPFIQGNVLGPRGKFEQKWIRVPNDKQKFIYSKYA